MPSRNQNTIHNAVEMTGIGFITGADIRLRFLPAGIDEGISFQRTDLPNTQPIQAVIENVVPQERRTVLEKGNVRVELIEHVMAALAGLQVDNCLVQIDGSELPGLDGSSLEFVNCLLAAGIEEQEKERAVFRFCSPIAVGDSMSGRTILGSQSSTGGLQLQYQLNYGSGSPIPVQQADFTVTPEVFHTEIAWARTFILESEIESLRAMGYGSRTTFQDLLVYGNSGVLDNELRAVNECARHKMLDCIGDFALLGCDLVGNISASQSGHSMNHQFIREIRQIQNREAETQKSKAA